MDDSWVWTRYWQFDRVASCMDGAGLSNYAAEVAEGWRNFFEELPPHSIVLDLCTGNGAIALLAAEIGRRNDRDFAVIGVDQAAIDPRRYVTKFREDLGHIEFRARVNVEELPFANQSVGAIVSQYGIEYTDMRRSLAEVERVLSPGGRLRFVVHAADGVVAAGARSTINDADYLLTEVDLPGVTARCLTAVLAVERGSDVTQEKKIVARAAIKQFEAALRGAAERMEIAIDRTMIRNAGSVLVDTYSKRRYFPLSRLLEKVDEVRTEIVAHKGRSRALVESALRDGDIGSICRQLGQAGLEVTYSSLKKQDRLIGYVLEGSKKL